MNFIKKIFDKKIDESVRMQFQKFSRGEFGNRAVINAKNVNGKYTIFTTAEFANEFVLDVAEKLGSKRANITGVIVSTSDLTGKLDFQDKKQFQGVKQYIIKKEMSGDEIIDLLNNFPKSFFALTFKSDDSEIKIKPKAPKSGKPGKNDDKIPKPNFCKLTTTDEKIGKSFVFEKPDFKKAEITHIFQIEQIIIPDEIKNEKDFAKIREMSRRGVRVLRNALIDGKEIKSKMEFEA